MLNQAKNQLYIYLSAFAIPILVALFLVTVSQIAFANTNYLSDKSLSPISEITTRLPVSFNETLAADIAVWKFGAGCPPETAIYIHGWNKDVTEAREEFNRIQSSLNSDGYKIPLIGFSWNSKVPYTDAIVNAEKNGPDLAKLIVAFHKKCPQTEIRLIAHSVGSEVLGNALLNLDTNSSGQRANEVNVTKILKSAHLIGATMNNNLITKDSRLGQAIEVMVDRFYNLYSHEDDGLQFNQMFGNRDPLGLAGAPNGALIPINYRDVNVAYRYFLFLMRMVMAMQRSALRKSNLFLSGEIVIVVTLA